ncbi:MAG: hypothetical protein ACYC1U_03005 [Candidatus Aquicultorales bacterium]
MKNQARGQTLSPQITRKEEYVCFKCGGNMSLDLKGKYYRCACGERCPKHLIKPGKAEDYLD